MPRVLVPMANGAEEMEAVIIVDVLRRAQWEVVIAGLQPGLVKASRGVMIQPDARWENLQPMTFDALILPGGSGGTEALKADGRVLQTIKDFVAARKWVGAICAAPTVLSAAGVLHQRRATSHPAVRRDLGDAIVSNDRVVVDGRIVTSQGPGTTFEFALTLIRLLSGEAAVQQVAGGLVL
jgi:protein deglycase